jgi:hypothetical protein
MSCAKYCPSIRSMSSSRMTPRNPIIIQKVTKRHLRNLWNDPDVQASILQRTTQQVDVFEELAPPSAGQEEGALSYVYDLMDNVNSRLLATFHCYKNRDGSIGASGLPDPMWLLVDDVMLYDP